MSLLRVLDLSEGDIHGCMGCWVSLLLGVITAINSTTPCVHLIQICCAILKLSARVREPKHIFMLMGEPEGHGCF
ncbi:MAG: hypothetical protein C5S48_04425 [Candidatus Methanogaster sp.]|nr:MAG: hypothetical protein C5S48_04425 [ANME-2 cluster archaeon]